MAWIAERKTMLSMLFFLLALGAYRWYAYKPGKARYILVALLFVLGLMAKPQVITLPCVLLLWDYWPLARLRLGTRQSGSSSGNRYPVQKPLPVGQGESSPFCYLPDRRLRDHESAKSGPSRVLAVHLP